jgi:hypothetical protein
MKCRNRFSGKEMGLSPSGDRPNSLDGIADAYQLAGTAAFSTLAA